MMGHFFDQNLLGHGGGLVFLDEVVQERLEFRGGFALDEAGAQAVEAGFGLPFVGAGSVRWTSAWRGFGPAWP